MLEQLSAAGKPLVVVLLNGSGNRDERRFADGDRFDIHRDIGHHLSFGYGKIISWDFDIPIAPHHIAPLDSAKLPHGIINPF